MCFIVQKIGRLKAGVKWNRDKRFFERVMEKRRKLASFRWIFDRFAGILSAVNPKGARNQWIRSLMTFGMDFASLCFQGRR